MTEERGVKGAIDTVGDAIRKLFKSTTEEGVRLSHLAKLHLEITGLKGKRSNIVRELGEQILQLIEEGKYAVWEVQGMVDEIAAFDRQIAAKEAEIKDLQEKEEKEGKPRKKEGEKKEKKEAKKEEGAKKSSPKKE